MQYIAMILGVFGLDMFMKDKIEEKDMQETGMPEEKQACRGMLLIRNHHNKGAFLNAGESNQKVVAALSVFLTVFVTLVFIATLTTKGSGLLKCGLSLLLGGAYSNTYDRLKRQYVVDYVSFNVPWKGLRQVVFNIGDFGIMLGALLSVFAGTNTEDKDNVSM